MYSGSGGVFLNIVQQCSKTLSVTLLGWLHLLADDDIAAKTNRRNSTVFSMPVPKSDGMVRAESAIARWQIDLCYKHALSNDERNMYVSDLLVHYSLLHVEFHI